MTLLHLTLLHKVTTTTVLALFPFLRLTFSLLCVFGRMRTMAKLLRVRRYLHNVRSQSTSCKRGRFMSRCCEIRLRFACVMYTCFISPNLCPRLMRPLPCEAICRNATTRRVASNHVSFSPLPHHCGARWAAHGPQCAVHHGANHGEGLCCLLPTVLRTHQQPCPCSFCERAMPLPAVLNGYCRQDPQLS